MIEAKTNEKREQGRTKTERDKASLAAPKHRGEPFSSAAIKAELQSNESRRWGALLSLLCVMSTANGQQMWRYFTSVALENIPAHKSN